MSLLTNTAGWRLTGNVGTDSSINFLGTVDTIDLVIKTNNLERFRVASDGSIGINKSDPSELLDIQETIDNDAAVIRLRHVSATGLASDAYLDLRVAAITSGDPHIRFNVQGPLDNKWSLGVDNSDSDSFKITEALGLATNARIKIEQGGKVFLNRNVEIGPAALTEVQFQLLSKPAQSGNIMQVGEDAGDLDGFFVMDEVGRVGIGISVNPSGRLHVDGSIDELQVLMQGHSTQTNNILEIQNSSATVQFSVGNTGDTLINGDLNHDGTKIGFFGTVPAVQVPAYAPINVTTDRSYDANITTVNELADVLGTLITDLQSYGLLP